MNGRVKTTLLELRILGNILDETIKMEKPRNMYIQVKIPSQNDHLGKQLIYFFIIFREISQRQFAMQFHHTVVILCFFDPM